MAFGVTTEGFNLKRLSDILDEIEDDLKSAFGNVDVSPSSVFGQLNGTFSKQLVEIWEQTQKAYNAASPNLSQDITLDYNTALNGLTRLGATSTEVEIGLNGDDLASIVSGLLVSSFTDSEVFILLNDVTITKLNQLKIFIVVDSIEDSTDYILTIVPVTEVYTYHSSSSATADEIAQGLYDEIILFGASATVIPTKLINGVLQLDAKTAAFDTDYTVNLTHYNTGSFESVNKGAIAAISNTINIIDTPVVGLDNVNNFEDGVKGRETEADSDLRLRLAESFQLSGAGTVSAIAARIQNDVEDVVSVVVYENRTDVVDGAGRPPHSFEVIVVGGEAEDIGNKIWEVKPAGIPPFGNTFFDVTDGNGDTQRMFFSRPINQYAWIIADLTLYSEEEFPVDGVDQVKSQILEYGDSLDIGVDIIPGRFFGPIYQVPGINTIAIQIAITPTEIGSPVYQVTTIPIAASEISVWDLSRITVNVP